MNMKEYVPVYADIFARFGHQRMRNYINYVRHNCKYNSLENYVLWSLYRYINREDGFVLFDAIHTKYPNTKDAHVLTMLKAAFKMQFGVDVETLANTAL